MKVDTLDSIIKPKSTIEKKGILVTKEVAERTVWDDLAAENPMHAVISAKNEADAAKKSIDQISHLKQYLKPTDVLLDMGAGYGRVAKYVLPEMTLGGYVAVDGSYEMLSLFKQRYESNEKEQRTPVKFINADIHTLPLQDNSVDVIIVSAVFLHNHKSIVKRSMTEAFRVLKSGGTILVYSSFPRGATLMGIQGHAYQMLLNLLGTPFKNGPVRYYSRREVAGLFSGFAELDLVPVGFGLLPKTIIFLPSPIEKVWRVGIANPANVLFERVIPTGLKQNFAVHFDVIAKK